MRFLRKKSIQQRLRQDPYYRMQSLEEVSWAAEIGVAVDVNRATVDDWLRLPGISIHQARSLASLTERGVQFLSLEDLAAALNLPIQRLQPLASVLNFSYYSPQLQYQRLNVNQATGQELTELAIAPELVQRIITERDRGDYQDFGDLQQRLSLSGEQVMALLQLFRFS